MRTSPVEAYWAQHMRKYVLKLGTSITLVLGLSACSVPDVPTTPGQAAQSLISVKNSVVQLGEQVQSAESSAISAANTAQATATSVGATVQQGATVATTALTKVGEATPTGVQVVKDSLTAVGETAEQGAATVTDGLETVGRAILQFAPSSNEAATGTAAPAP